MLYKISEIMDSIKRMFGFLKPEEKVRKYRELLESFGSYEHIGKSLAEKFEFQKSIIDSIDVMPEEKKTEVMANYDSFLKSHRVEVARAMNERGKILKAMESLEGDAEVGQECKRIRALDRLKKSYESGRLDRKNYFSILKSITGKKTKYADVVVMNDDWRMLILHRVDDDMNPTGKVCIPGGHVDEGEDFMTAALRELKEETNLDPIKEKGIVELGRHTDKDADIRYYLVHVDKNQPVTVEGAEHCFAEWIDLGEIFDKPFIYDQGKIVFDLMMHRGYPEKVLPIVNAYEEHRMEKSVFVSAVSKMIRKGLEVADVKPLMPESMDGDKRKLKVPVRDPMCCVSNILKGLDGEEEVIFNDTTSVRFAKPLFIHDVSYERDPKNNRIIEMEVVFTGDDSDMANVLNQMKYGLSRGPMKVRTAHEEFLAANENGTDYVGDPVFVSL